MEIVPYILYLAVTGLFVGALARFGLPGRDPMSLFQTMLVGVAGSLIAGLISRYAFDREATPGILLSVLCALGIVFAVRKVRERSVGSAPPARSATFGGPFGGGGAQVRFMPGCLITSLLLSVGLTIFLNLLLRAF
jgi:uncharacterized membrane protein YeaQ/YmgE (transglycosylase-associated protein family)